MPSIKRVCVWVIPQVVKLFPSLNLMAESLEAPTEEAGMNEQRGGGGGGRGRRRGEEVFVLKENGD